MDHLQAIRVFARVIETGSFNQAARSLEMPGSTVSKWVADLEAGLGVKLLERSTRKIGVTAAGALYYDSTRRLMAELDDLESTLGQGQASPRGMLRVDCGGATASALLIPALPAFCARYPDIDLRLTVNDRNADLLSDNIDCAIRSGADDPTLVSRLLGQSRWTTCASPAWLSRYGTPTTPQQISAAKMPVVSYFSSTSGLAHRLEFEKDAERISLQHLGTRVAVNESNAHLAAALAGLGLIQTADFIVRPHLASGALVAVLADWERPPLQIYLAYLPSRRDNARVKAFSAWATGLLRAEQPGQT
ncbi:LysR substrate-binding domain-containing protein [Massilia sp. DWR3-1-1]|uniref:LysR substrate-binding domain-containing protein n=1 Tax=Massilia sp. DWR3-1-1 TaxID=2804559 RepID=UPI003CF50741